MSVFLADEIQQGGYLPTDLQKHWAGYWIFSLSVDQLREEFGQVVSRDPQPEFPGHALVKDPSGKRTQGTRSRMAHRCVLEAAGDALPAAPAPLDLVQSEVDRPQPTEHESGTSRLRSRLRNPFGRV